MSPNADPNEAVTALLTLRRRHKYFGNSMPADVWPILQANLPKGSLPSFLKERPDLFRVVAERARSPKGGESVCFMVL